VAVYNEKERKYQVYMTNIGVDRLEAEKVALLYRARWETELTFKELKSRYQMNLVPSAKSEVVEAFIWIGILTLLYSKRIFIMVRSVNPEKSSRFTHMRWANVFAENAPDLMRDVIRSNGLRYDLMVFLEIFSSQA
jgi:IS4 transposase